MKRFYVAPRVGESPEDQRKAGKGLAAAALRRDGLAAGVEGPLDPHIEAGLVEALNALGVTPNGKRVGRMHRRR